MSLIEPPRASLRLRVDAAALKENWKTLDRLSGGAETGAAIKADGYGLGVDNVAPPLIAAGARTFFLAHWSEVGPMMRHVEGSALGVLHGVRNEEEAAFARATGTIPVINSLRQAALWTRTGGGPCHLMIDSGINRLGIAPSEVGDPIIQSLDVDILMSHLASADEDTPRNARQLGIFLEAAQRLSSQRLSLANSAGIALGADYHLGLTRPGLSLYGGVQRGELEGRIAQVAFPEAAVIQLRELSPGDSVGYNAAWTADRTVCAATVSIGYADGFLRARGRDAVLQHGDEHLPVIGRVSMDMVVVDATRSDVAEGDFLSIPFNLPEVSRQSGLSQYELLTTLGDRYDTL